MKFRSPEQLSREEPAVVRFERTFNRDTVRNWLAEAIGKLEDAQRRDNLPSTRMDAAYDAILFSALALFALRRFRLAGGTGHHRLALEGMAHLLERIVTQTRAVFARLGHWPSHPRDRDADAPAPHPSVYFGTAGIIWALAQFGVRYPNAAELLRECVDESQVLIDRMVADAGWDPAVLPHYVRGLLLGSSGVFLVAARITKDAQAADHLYDLARANVANPIREFMWGAPGTMLAAQSMYDATGDARWRTVFTDSAAQLLRELTPAPEIGAQLWVQHLYGHKVSLLGAVHGFAGNVAPVIAGKHLLPRSEYAPWQQLAFETTKASAVIEDGLANWPPSIGASRPGRTQILVQHCHGAPGIVVALGALLDGTDPAFDALLLQAGELTWHAGPLAKGPNLCHGTAGNGYAFLRLFQQTQDEEWLTRARAFAMHAIEQSEQAEREHGDLWHSLWTGDIGVALYLRACIETDPRFPTFGWF